MSFGAGMVVAANDKAYGKVKVKTLAVVQMGMFVNDESMVFGVANLGHPDCFIVSPPLGASLIIGDEYSFIEETGIDEMMRKEFSYLYAGCVAVRVRDNSETNPR